MSEHPEADLELPEDGEPVTIEVVRGGPLIVSAPTLGTFPRASTVPEPVPRITDEMVWRALAAYWDRPKFPPTSDVEAMHAALEAALAPPSLRHRPTRCESVPIPKPLVGISNCPSRRRASGSGSRLPRELRPSASTAADGYQAP